MFSRLSKRSKVEKILLITLSNIGDVILTFPVFDALKEMYPDADISVVAGPKVKDILEDNPHIHKVYFYDKRASLEAKWQWLKDLRRSPFDLVIDLRNSMMPFLVRTKAFTLPALGRQGSLHMKDRHFDRLKSILPKAKLSTHRLALYISPADEKYAWDLVKGHSQYVIVAPGAADLRKRWPEENFIAVIDHLVRIYKVKIVLVGDQKDSVIASRIIKKVPAGVVDLTGLTTLPQLAAVLKRARIALTNDSGIMHLASYLNIPVIALFGPTDPALYGPWSGNRYVLCQGHEMRGVTPDDACSAFEDWFHGHASI